MCPITQGRPAGPVAGTAQAGSPAALAAAMDAERDGRDTDAESGYRALLVTADPVLNAEANLALGRYLERSGHSLAAEAPLQTALTGPLPPPDRLGARFLLGEAESDQKQYAAAARDFQSYVDSGGQADGYGRIETAWAFQSAGDDHAALAALLLPMQSPSRTVRQAALAAGAESLDRLGNDTAAAVDQESLANTAAAPSDRAAALLAAGRFYHKAGADAKAAALLNRLLQTYPSSGSAGDGLDLLDSMGSRVDPMQRALVLVSLRRNDSAKSALQAILATHPFAPVAARATYELAVLADRADQNDDALAGYQSAATLDPGSEIAADALWNQAQLLQSLDRYAAAQNVYSDLASRFPSSPHAGDALFGAGLMAYVDGRAADAAQLWTRAAQSHDPSTAARANLWLMKLALGRSDLATATSNLNSAWTSQPAGYFALRAAMLASGSRGPSLSGPAVSAPSPADWKSVETWLASWAGPENAAGFQSMQLQDDWSEGLALDGLGWQTTPASLIDDAIASQKSHPWVLYRAARALQSRGLTRLAIDASDDLLDLAPGGRFNAPQILLRLDYPLDYVSRVNQDAAQDGIDPLLISALVRQESLFDPAVGSSAGAQGLMQLVPGTAVDVAQATGIAGLSTADLKRPDVNLELGAAYLEREVKAESGDLSASLAAYNAGGGNADRWAKTAGADTDLFYEMVDFDETRQYIRLVSQNYAVYNFLYRGLPRPSLLHP